MVLGVVLASGRSVRMGRPKALLSVPGSEDSFVGRLAATFLAGGLPEVLVVGRPEDTALQSAVEGLAQAIRFVPNAQAEHGQLTSILAALRAADRPGVQGLLVCPVDIPFVKASTIAALLSSFVATRAPIVRAVHQGAHGHPVLFSRAVFEELRHADPALGAKAVVRSHQDLVDVEVADPGVVLDVDTPEDYQRLVDEANRAGVGYN